MTAEHAVQPLDAGPFAAALRRFRAARRMSQLDLAMDCDVSARHLSFLESGRAQPSRE
ncbi:MAG: helix-turn-helix transcriptional regulator, partial [Proteobacteria bacterium]|nr:helix-turn-helix transcriptional regulator [Pseudomonadota bacterium]